MPFDFTGLDSALIAQFWIYFLASGVICFLLGIIITRAFFHREKVLIAKEKEQYDASKKELEILEAQLEDKAAKLEALEASIAESEKYWAAVATKTSGAKPADVALHAAIHATD